MRKLLLVLTLLLSISTYVAAQNYTEVVYLKNGSIIKGVIIEQVPNVSLTLIPQHYYKYNFLST